MGVLTMKIFAAFTEAGRVAAFWSDDLFPPTEEGDRNRGIPADAIEIDLETHKLLVEYPDAWRMVDGLLTPYVPPAPSVSTAAVDAERDRRINGGFDYGGVTYQTRPGDRENMAGTSAAALAAIVAGAAGGNLRWHGGDSDFAWIATDNSTHPMDAQTMFAFGQAAMAHKQAHIFAARALKDMTPIPADYATNSAYWP